MYIRTFETNSVCSSPKIHCSDSISHLPNKKNKINPLEQTSIRKLMIKTRSLSKNQKEHEELEITPIITQHQY